MKRLGILFVCFATMAMTSCGMLQNVSSSNALAQASGQACGTAVLGLYSSYKTTGKLDLTNATNFSNALALASAYSQLQQNKDNSAYRSAFTTGLIASSAGLVTTANATSFLDKLLGTTALGSISAERVTQTASTAMAIITLLNALKQ